MVNKIVQ